MTARILVGPVASISSPYSASRAENSPAEGQAVNAYVCTIGVASVDEYVGKALAAGGTLAVPKMPIKGVGWLAYCKDTEGNIFGMMQEDRSAG